MEGDRKDAVNEFAKTIYTRFVQSHVHHPHAVCASRLLCTTRQTPSLCVSRYPHFVTHPKFDFTTDTAAFGSSNMTHAQTMSLFVSGANTDSSLDVLFGGVLTHHTKK
jgi:hypothetical protein